MRFMEFAYTRPDMNELENHLGALIERLENETTAEGQNSVMAEIHGLRTDYESMCEIAYIRYTMDTSNAAYMAEQDFIDETRPLYQQLVSQYYRAITRRSKPGWTKSMIADYSGRSLIMASILVRNRRVSCFCCGSWKERALACS
ncbi:hypothetical protein BCM02_10128 [Paenibacillus methanolicus]|uniref:Uncharacterized protein n=1 Tax=Paenibacillus methanolicus TaxID=582686 RepID=A0A5S5CIR6_9BACL|nr:hypothetical protein BCM02_10128 [Paenibacillus methanolicus]